MKHFYTHFAVCFFLLCGTLSVSAQPLYPFPSPGLVQTEVYHWDWTQLFVPGNHSFLHQGDTVIATDTFAKFAYIPVGSSNSWYTWYDNGKVYWQGNTPLNNPSTGTLIYDFSLGVGDTFFCSMGFVIYGTYTVSSVSTITLLNSQVRKYMELVQGTDTLRWIDGIGDIEHGLFYASDGEGGYEEFICARDSAGPLYAAPASPFYCNENNPVPTAGPNSCAPFTYNVKIYGTSCIGCYGSVVIGLLSGGQAPYTYTWSNGGTGSSQYNLCEGPVTVTIHDANGDSCTRTYVVPENTLQATVLSPDIDHCDGIDTFCVSPTGGTAPYVYQWSTGSTSSCIVVTVNGVYTIYVVDANGCTATYTFTFTITPITDNTQPTGTSCVGCCDGDVNLTITGGTPPYTITYPNGPWPAANNFCEGWYHYCVTDSMGCMKCDSIFVMDPLSVQPAASAEFSVMPNPAADVVQITRESAQASVLRIHDVAGKIVHEQQLTGRSIRIDVSALASGTYLFVIDGRAQRIVISRE